jgi:hypothetical protein
VPWPKKLSKARTDMTEEVVRDTEVGSELADFKVCSVDDTWSALKLVIPKKNRK